jgi:hypothetical protein
MYDCSGQLLILNHEKQQLVRKLAKLLNKERIIYTGVPVPLMNHLHSLIPHAYLLAES